MRNVLEWSRAMSLAVTMHHSFWPALSGRGNFLTSVPRALPSATMVEAFGLRIPAATEDIRASSSCFAGLRRAGQFFNRNMPFSHS